VLAPLALNRARAMATVTVTIFVAIIGVAVYGALGTEPEGSPLAYVPGEGITMAQFDSEAQFQSYMQESDALYSYHGWGGMRVLAQDSWNEAGVPVPAPAPGKGETISGTSDADRVSGTNVQVAGIDEPDIVKTDGQSIFFSSENFYYYPRPIMWEETVSSDEGNGSSEAEAKEWVPPVWYAETRVIDALPAENVSIAASINMTGDLLLYGDTLMVFTWDTIYGYDVSDPQSPALDWELTLGNSTSVKGARLYGDKVYLITETWVERYHPCPIEPLLQGGTALKVMCTDIYYPIAPFDVDVTYTAMIFDPATGDITDSVSFVGSSYSSVIYMSPNAIYVTYPQYPDVLPFALDFLTEECGDLLPASVMEDLAALQGYDISDSSKLNEIGVILEEHLASLSTNDYTRTVNELSNRINDYLEQHKREFERTGIVKIGLSSLDILATGSVSGHPLNQFSLDEWGGHLRIATTVEGSFGFSMFWGWWESVNDVYVLDSDLNVVGMVMDLGLTERIYSARFIEDKGYLVTFRQTDPFYVMDLSDPQHPQVTGELKIPGYSSYLHPITGDLILGIGMDGGKVKVSLFDVSDPANPSEADKYSLSEYWSDILNTHHAFLLDEKHGIFFLPGSSGGYIFSYTDNQLELVKAVGDIYARRAVYINDYLYIIGDDGMVVLDETDWEEVSSLDF
jgi:inhibitor of cysteine peptidase